MTINSEETFFNQAMDAAKSLVPLQSLRKSFFEALIDRSHVETYVADHEIFAQRSYSKLHHFLLNGTVLLESDSGYEELIDAATCYGPLCVSNPKRYSAKTQSDCLVLTIDSEELDRLLSWSQISDYLLAELSMNRNYDEDFEWIQSVLTSNLFLKVPPVNAEQILDRLTPMVVHEGEVIVRQGEVGDCCYFIKEGTADVARYEEGDGWQTLARIQAGRCFGEDALVYETTRNANVTMSSDGVLMRLEKSDFLLLLRPPMIDELSQSDLHALQEEPIYIDVRTEGEYNEGHLAFSANVPLNLLALKARLFDTSRLHIVYCDTGLRSASAAFLLGKQGYNVMTLKGGLNEQEMHEFLVQGDAHILHDGDLSAES